MHAAITVQYIVRPSGNNYYLWTGTSHDDSIRGVRGESNTIRGGDGNDTLAAGRSGGEEVNGLFGGSGNDILRGGLGDDRLLGDEGADHMAGGLGDDNYYVDNLGDVVVEKMVGSTPGSNDVVFSSVSFDLTGTAVEKLILLGDETARVGTGNHLNNVIQGNRFANTLDGGKGIDTLIGGDGDDTYLVHHIRDVAKEGERGREPTGHDTVLAFNSVKLQRWIEDIHLQEVTGSTGDLVAGFTAIGNREDNTITGNATRNNLNGLFGNDTLTGNGGADDFIFSVALGAENVDTITDFTPGEDRIVLKAALLPGLGRGALDPALFHAGAGAAAGDHRLVWDGTTLWHDPDGSADTSPEAIATLLGAPTLTAADIWVA